MLPQLRLKCCTGFVVIHGRTIGGLTGSRTAGFLGRIPVESIIKERRVSWTAAGSHADRHVHCVSTWVDNLFGAFDSLSGAIQILEDVELQLNRRRQLNMKQSSRSYMVAHGNAEVPDDRARWPLVDSFVVFGHILQSNTWA